MYKYVLLIPWRDGCSGPDIPGRATTRPLSVKEQDGGRLNPLLPVIRGRNADMSHCLDFPGLAAMLQL